MDERPVIERATQASYASLPTRWTRHKRVKLLIQLWCFVVINFKMIRVILRSHRGH